jgi:hypothetical protein
MLEGLSLGNYLVLVDYTGGMFREGKSVISAAVSGILERLGRTRAGGRGWRNCALAGSSAGSSQQRASGCAKRPAAWACITWPT